MPSTAWPGNLGLEPVCGFWRKGLIRALGLVVLGGGSGPPPPAPPEAETTAWVNAVIANGGTSSAGTQTAVNDFIVGTKADGTFTKLIRLNLMCGDQYAACSVPQVVGTGNAIEGNPASFVAGDYTEATGLTTDGVKYWNTGQVLPVTTGGMFVYSPTTLILNKAYMACQNGAATQLYRLGTEGTAKGRGIYGGSNSATDTAAHGFGAWHTLRGGATDLRLFKNGVSVASNAVSTTPIAITEAVFIFGRNNAGVPDFRMASGGQIRGYSIDDGTMSAAQMLSYYNRWQTLQTALGRAV